MTVTLLQVLGAARAACAPVVGEIAGYLVLGVADQVVGAPRQVLARDILLQQDGALRLLGGMASSDVEAEQALRGLLQRLLVDARSATLALVRASQRPPGAGVAALVRELEAGLIPVNRSAGRRALSRLCRQTVRALESGKVPAEAEQVAEQSLPQPPQSELALDDCPLHGADPEVSFSEVEITVVDADVASRPSDTCLVELGDVEQLLSQETDRCASELPAEQATLPEPVVVRASAVAHTAEPRLQEAPAQATALPPVETLSPLSDLTPLLGSVVVRGEPPQGVCLPADSCGQAAAPGSAEGEQTDPMPQSQSQELEPEQPGEQPGQQSPAQSAEPAPVSAAGEPLEPSVPMWEWLGQELEPEQPGEEPGPQSLAQSAEPAPVFAAAELLEPRATVHIEPAPAGASAEAHTRYADEAHTKPAELGSVLVQSEPPPVASWLDESLPPEDGWDLPDAVYQSRQPGQTAGEQQAAEQTYSQADRTDSSLAEPRADPEQPLGRDGPAAVRPSPAPSAFLPRYSDVKALVASFSVAGQKAEDELCRDLKSMAGVDATPLPPAAGRED